MFLIVKLVMIGLIAMANRDICEQAYKDIVSGELKHGYEMLYNSGRDVNDLGLYADCVDLKGARYYLMVTEHRSITLALGLCVPKQCSSSDLEELSSDLAYYYNNSGMIKMAEKAKFKESKSYNNRELSSSALCFLIFFLVYFSVVLVSCFLDFLSEKFPDRDYKKKYSYLLVFSLKENYRNLFLVSDDKADQMINTQSFYGIKVISILLIFYAHMNFYYGSSAISNLEQALEVFKSFRHRIVLLGVYSVDIFLLIGGFLLGFFGLELLRKNNGKMNWFFYYTHRVLRIVPVYFTVSAFYMFLFPYVGGGPAWYLVEHKDKSCKNDWWTNYLFLSNFVPVNKAACMSWSWYIVCDMQFYLLSPILLIIQYKKKILGYSVCASLIIINILYVIIEYSVNDYPLSSSSRLVSIEQFNALSIKPYSRMGPYLIGLILGFLLLDYQTLLKQPKKKPSLEMLDLKQNLLDFQNFSIEALNWEIKAVGWVHRLRYRVFSMSFGFALMALITCIPYTYDQDYHWPQVIISIYSGFEHIGFSFGFVLFILPLMLNYCKGLNSFLSSWFFKVTSKLCLAAYLIHPVVIIYSSTGTQQSIYFEDVFIFFRSFALLQLTLISSIFLYCLIESPVIRLEKLLIKH